MTQITARLPVPWILIAVVMAGCAVPVPGDAEATRLVYDALDGQGEVIGQIRLRPEGPAVGLDAASKATPALRVTMEAELNLPGFLKRTEELFIAADGGRILEVLGPCGEGTGCPTGARRWVRGYESDSFPFGAPLVGHLPPGDWTLRLLHRSESFNATARVELLPDGSRAIRLLEPSGLPTLQPCSILGGELRILPDGTVESCTVDGEGSILRLREGRWPTRAFQPEALQAGLTLRAREPPGYPDEVGDGSEPFPLPEAIAAANRDEGARSFQARHGPMDVLTAKPVLRETRSLACTGFGCATAQESQTWEVSFIARDGRVWEVVVRQDDARGPSGASLRREQVVVRSQPATPLAPVARPFAGALVALEAARKWMEDFDLPQVTGFGLHGEMVGRPAETSLRHRVFADVSQQEESSELDRWFVAWDAESGLMDQAVLGEADIQRLRERLAG